MSGGDFIPELNRIKIESPTEDGKIAYVMNTMVPRRLEQFDDIRNDLAKRDFNTDKTYFYVNFQAGDFCGRSYKLPLSELNEFVTKSLLFGTSGKEPVIKFDENFYLNEDNEIHLIITSTTPTSTQITLMEYLEQLVSKNEEQDEALQAESFVRERDDKELELKKADKFVIFGTGDELNSETGLPEPKDEDENDAYGVHVTYHPMLDSEGNYTSDPTRGVKPILGPKIGVDAEGKDIFGPAIMIDHDYRFAQTITSKFDIGGIGKGQTILKGTPLETFIWQLLRGDPVIENIIYWKASDRLPISASTWTGLGPWGHNKTTTNDDLLSVADPTYTWKGILEFTINTNDEFLMISVPRSNSTGFKPDDQGQWVVPLLNSNKAPKGIRLNEIYLKDAPQFKVNFKTIEIRNEDESTEWGYKLYYIDEKSYYPQGQTWVAEFVPNV